MRCPNSLCFPDKYYIRLENRSAGRIHNLVKAPCKDKTAGPHEFIDLVKERLLFVQFHHTRFDDKHIHALH